jgi:hypothetical protein
MHSNAALSMHYIAYGCSFVLPPTTLDEFVSGFYVPFHSLPIHSLCVYHVRFAVPSILEVRSIRGALSTEDREGKEMPPSPFERYIAMPATPYCPGIGTCCSWFHKGAR